MNLPEMDWPVGRCGSAGFAGVDSQGRVGRCGFAGVDLPRRIRRSGFSKFSKLSFEVEFLNGISQGKWNFGVGCLNNFLKLTYEVDFRGGFLKLRLEVEFRGEMVM